SPRRQSLRKILPPTSRHQTVGGFYYILFVDGPCYILFVARSLGSSYQRYHPNNCSYAWPRHSCNHFYSSKLADASQFTSLSLSQGGGLKTGGPNMTAAPAPPPRRSLLAGSAATGAVSLLPIHFVVARAQSKQGGSPLGTTKADAILPFRVNVRGEDL